MWRQPFGWLGAALIVAAGICAILAGSNYVRANLATCEALDRLLLRSGCVAKVHIPAFRPLDSSAIVPRDGTTAWLFGHSTNFGEPQPLVRFIINTKEGRIAGEGPLRFPAGTEYRLVRQLGDGRVAITCVGKSTCERLSAGGWQQGYILSIETGETVGEIPDVTAFQSTVLQKQETEIPLNGALSRTAISQLIRMPTAKASCSGGCPTEASSIG